jgi:hypothetical protein
MVQITVQIMEVMITGQMFILMQFLSCGRFYHKSRSGKQTKNWEADGFFWVSNHVQKKKLK